MTQNKPAATPATVTITADSLGALFGALAAELCPPEPALGADGDYERWREARDDRRAGVLAELRMLARACEVPANIGWEVEAITKMAVAELAKPVGYAVKEAGE
jgi:hypothetical protein